MAPLLKVSIFSFAALVSVAGLIVTVALARWRTDTGELRGRLAAAPAWSEAPVTADDWAGLPPPVARYLAAVIPPGHAVVAHARIDWAGQFNMGAPSADRWVTFDAVQDFYPHAPGMVWDARLRVAPGMPVFVRDGFADGAGSMYGAMVAVFPVVDASGTAAIAEAALQRYLGEAVWFPTALLPRQGVTWSAVDDRRAVATLRAGTVTASVEFRFGSDGLVESTFVPDRSFDDGRGAPRPEPWQARVYDYRREDGLFVPGRAVAEWLLHAGPYEYWRGSPTRIAYDLAIDADR